MYRYWSIAISAHHTNRDRNHNHRRMSKVTHQNPSAPPESLESALSSTNMETVQSSLVFHHNSPAMFQHINFIILGHNHRWSTSRKHKETIADFNWRFELTRCYCWWGLMLSDHLPFGKTDAIFQTLNWDVWSSTQECPFESKFQICACSCRIHGCQHMVANLNHLISDNRLISDSCTCWKWSCRPYQASQTVTNLSSHSLINDLHHVALSFTMPPYSP